MRIAIEAIALDLIAVLQSGWSEPKKNPVQTAAPGNRYTKTVQKGARAYG